jgi:hypothetical protein
MDGNCRRASHRRVGAAMALAVAIAWLAAPARSGAANTRIKVEYDKTFSFAGLRTWTWHPDGAGDVRLAVSSQDDPKRVAARVDPVIVPAVEREMIARGFRQTTGSADVYVHYYALATIGQSAQYHGQFVPAVPDWGLPPFAPSTSALSIDVTSTAAGQIIWRGAAERTIDLERPDDQRREVLERAIRDLLRKFPPKR